MTVATVEPTPPHMRLVSSIRALRAIRKETNQQLMAVLGMTKSTWFGRMQTGDFTVAEAVRLAEHFDVPLQKLLDGELTLPKKSRTLTSVPGEGRTTSPTSPLLALLDNETITTAGVTCK